MNMHWLDWLIVLSLFSFVTGMALYTRRFTRSVADFLAAGRSAGRYVITVSEGAAALGAITIVGAFEKNFQAGFTSAWWDTPVLAIGFFASLAGWVIYRFRQTRAMTMAQFFEMRYSRQFRVFAGILAFISGLINFGIFPAVGARFFIYFCGLPEQFTLLGIGISTFATIMILLLGIALLFTFAGGQIAVIVTDFIQGLFCFVAFLLIFIVLSQKFSWTQISEALAMAPPDASLVDPNRISEVKGFDTAFFLIAMFAAFYTTRSWQGTSGYNCSARTAHEAKMGGVLGKWREIMQVMLILIMPICAYTFLHHPDFTDQVAAATGTLNTIDTEQMRVQVTVPVVLSSILPKGMMGVLCAVMLSSFISTHDTYLHSWGSIFIQDVVIPLRKKHLTPKQHLRLLRISIFGVAAFIFFFSLLFRQNDNILMFFAMSGAIFLGGAGSVIIGGLYWKRGTTAGAWAALITGCTVAGTGMIAKQLYPDFPDGQRVNFWAMIAAIVAYVVVSLLTKQPNLNMDKILHRGKFAVADDSATSCPSTDTGWRMLMMGKEFTRGDKVIYVTFITWVIGWTIIFLFGTIYGRVTGIELSSWLNFWHYYLWMAFVLGTITTIWFGIGGIKDLRDMFRRLATADRDESDDGTVAHDNAD